MSQSFLFSVEAQQVLVATSALRSFHALVKSWIEPAKTRLHRNVLAIALANKLARIAWAVAPRPA